MPIEKRSRFSSSNDETARLRGTLQARGVPLLKLQLSRALFKQILRDPTLPPKPRPHLSREPPVPLTQGSELSGFRRIALKCSPNTSRNDASVAKRFFCNCERYYPAGNYLKSLRQLDARSHHAKDFGLAGPPARS